jgi:putative transposase
MKRRTMRRREIERTARFLTFCCHRRLPLFQNERIRDHFIQQLTYVATELDVAVLAWVVMPEHVHLVVYARSPDVTMTRFTHRLKRPFAFKVLNRWRTLDAPILAHLKHGEGHRFWQTGGGFDRNVIGEELREKVRYIHDNPVRRGLVVRATDYRWTSAAAYEGRPWPGPAIDVSLLPGNL